MADRFNGGSLLDAAYGIAYSSTGFQVFNEDHQSHGCGSMRWDQKSIDPALKKQYGFRVLVCGAKFRAIRINPLQ